MISIKQVLFSVLLSSSLAFCLNSSASSYPQSSKSNSPATTERPLYVAYSYRYGTRNYKQSRRNSRRYGSYSRYRNSHRSGRYSHNYRRSHFRSHYGADDIKKVKKKTVWEAPTSLDKKINEEIEKAQVNEGPTSKAAGDLMYKYAKRYYDTKDYEKAKKMTDRMIKLDDVSEFDGIKMSEVKKLRLDAIAKINGSANKAKSTHKGPRYSLLGSKSRKFKPAYSLLAPRSPALPSLLSGPAYSRSRQKYWSKYKTNHAKPSSTAIGKVNKKGKGVTEFDYSPSAVAQTRNRPSISSSSSSGGARAYPSTIRSRSYQYPGTGTSSTYRRSPIFFKYPRFQHHDQGKLETLDGKFKKYKSQ